MDEKNAVDAEVEVASTTPTDSDIHGANPEADKGQPLKVAKTLEYSEEQKLQLELAATHVALANSPLKDIIERLQRLQAQSDELAVEYRKNFDALSTKVAALSAQHDNLRDAAVARTEKFKTTVAEVLGACGESDLDENWSIEFTEDFQLKHIVLYEEEEK
jgi:hypothetical protein